jgi:tripartite-type tricarboxylate transporter receptor subunit TctC
VCGTSGYGSTGHLAGAFLRQEQGVRLSFRPLEVDDGYAQLAAGRIDALFDGLPSALVKLPRTRGRALAVTSASRTPLLPDVPAFGERWQESFEAWIGLIAPKGIRHDAYVRLAPVIGVLLDDSARVGELRAAGLTYLGASGREMTAFVESDILRTAKLIARFGDESPR